MELGIEKYAMQIMKNGKNTKRLMTIYKVLHPRHAIYFVTK